MTITKMYCDHCGKELNDMIDYTCCEVEVEYETISTDLCKDCLELLSTTIKQFCSTAKGGESE